MKSAVAADHGRIESRTAAITAAVAWLAHHGRPRPQGHRHGRPSPRTRRQDLHRGSLDLLSTALSPERPTEVARLHRGIENLLHRRLDLVMNEDQDRAPRPARQCPPPHNIAVLRHMALDALQKEGSKGSLRGKFKRAGWSDAFLSSLLAPF